MGYSGPQKYEGFPDHENGYKIFMQQSLSHFQGTEDTKSTISNFLSTLKSCTGFESVAVRIMNGEEFPYYEANGFPADFVEAEGDLFAKDIDGRIKRGPGGRVTLDCICGSVISGRTDPSLECFTEYGSFWTNRASDLFGEASFQDAGFLTRELCRSAGYESMALIPIHSNAKCIGLLQMNDRRRDMFAPGFMDALESLCLSVGLYLGRRILEDQVRTFFLEKDVLLGEIHHRVRNNLQLIMSLMHLQSGYCKHEDDRQVFIGSERRIKSIAAIQDQLYSSGDFLRIKLNGFLSNLVRDLVMIHDRTEEDLDVHIDTDDVFLRVDSAIACGMLISELVSNSLIHAFPPGSCGTISITLMMREGGEPELVYSDTGIGLPEGMDICGTNTFGMKLINLLAAQIRGGLEINSAAGAGTEVRLCFVSDHIFRPLQDDE